MPYNGKSPMNFLGGMAALARVGQFSDETLRNKYDKLAGSAFSNLSIGKKMMAGYEAEIKRRQSIGNFGQAPSVVNTAGAGNMSGRIESIESRLQALEGGGNQSQDPSLAQKAQAAAAAAQAGSIATDATAQVSNPLGLSTAGITGAATNTIPPAAENITPAADALGQNFASSPFFKRQRTNTGPLMFKDQTGDGKITRADVIKARIEGYKK